MSGFGVEGTFNSLKDGLNDVGISVLILYLNSPRVIIDNCTENTIIN